MDQEEKYATDGIICEMFQQGYTLRHISETISRDHHYVKRRLEANNVKVVRHKTKKPYTDEHRRKVSIATKGRKVWSEGKTMTREHNLKNMLSHLRYDVDFEWLNQFEDIERLKYLNRAMSRKRDCMGYTTEDYKAYIKKFYNDEDFVRLFNLWVSTGDKYIKPSLDHIKPKAKGGGLDVGNIRFVSWFENRAKNDIPLEDWEKIKRNIQKYL